MNGDAYWYKNGKLIEVGTYHIADINGNPKTFGLTREYIVDLHKKYNERLGQEGKAREEIMNKVISDGWIRIRQYNGNAWVINFDSYKKREKDIKELISVLLLDKKTMKKTDLVRLTSIDGKYNETYDGFMGTSITSILSEEDIENRKRIVIVESYSYFDY